MMNKLLLLSALIFLMACSATKNAAVSKFYSKKIELDTDSGTIILQLYNKTPLHRDNFLKLVKQHYFDSLLFHRVIKNFMIQGGDPDSKNAKPKVLLGDGGPAYTIPAEFNDSLFHKKGVLAAAREGDDINPAKASSASQFYIVQGKKFTDAGLDSVEKYRLKGRKIPASHREVYKTIGGTPHLDMSYTIFGEVISGLEVVDKIAGTATDNNNRPLTDIRMKMRILKKK